MEIQANTVSINGIEYIRADAVPTAKPNGQCLIWPGSKDKDGYGFVKIQGIQKRAHRVALEKKLGRSIAEGLQALHTCHNPSCVNPDHLEEGSNKTNQHQRRAREASLAKQVLGVNAY